MSSELDETKKSITNSLSLSKLAGNKISKSNTISYFNSFHFDKHFSQAKASLNIPVHQRGILFCFVLFCLINTAYLHRVDSLNLKQKKSTRNVAAL